MRRLPGPLGLVLVAAVGIAACSISEDSSPRDIPVEERGIFGQTAAGEAAAGESRIYLIAASETDQPVLRSVLRDVPSDDPEDVLNSLLSGPNESELLDDQLETAIPADLELLGTRTRGQVLTVDVNDVFTDLTVSGLRLAVAQIVTTATGIDTVERVRLRIDGESQDWPIGNNEFTNRPLSVYDYPGLIESTQPPFPAIPSGN